MKACCQLTLDGICRGSEASTSGPASTDSRHIHTEKDALENSNLAEFLSGRCGRRAAGRYSGQCQQIVGAL